MEEFRTWLGLDKDHGVMGTCGHSKERMLPQGVLGCNLPFELFIEESIDLSEFSGINNKKVCNISLPSQEFPGKVKLC